MYKKNTDSTTLVAFGMRTARPAYPFYESRRQTLSTETEGMGNTAYELGKYTLYLDGGQVADHGKYIVIWKQEAGQWKLHLDIWNTSASPPNMTEK